MNLRDLKERIFQQTNNIYNDQHHMRSLINEAINMLATDAKLKAEQTIATVSGTASYPLPVNFKEPIALVEGSIENPVMIYDLVETVGEQWGYTIFVDELVLRPVPASAKTLKLYYYAYPAELVNETDELPFDSRYANAVSSYASAMILTLPGIEGVSQSLIDRYFGIWETAREQFKADQQRKNKRSTVRKVAQYW